jgi:hypothetical protein
MAFVLVIGLMLYLLLLKLENFSVEMKELEIILFFTFLVFWVNLLIYKNAFLTHGLLVVWQNIPVSILSNFFSNIGFIQVLGAVSVIPIVFGVYAFYAAFHLEHSKDVMILVSLGLSAFILLWFKLLDLISGLIVLSIVLTILTAYTLKILDDFLEKSKIHKYEKLIHLAIIVLFLITVIPSILYINSRSTIGPLDTPAQSDIETLQWASENLPDNAVIAAGLDEGNIVTYYAKRKNIMDTNFLLTPRIDLRLKELDEIYTTTFETKAIDILNKYNANYILITRETLNKYNINEIAYMQSNKCFAPVHVNKDTYLYRTECKIE